MYHQVSRGDEHRTRRGAAGHEDGRQDGREAGHGAGHEDISWTREGGAGGMRERRRRRPGRSRTRSDRPPDRTARFLARSTGRQPAANRMRFIVPGKNRIFANFPVCRPVDRTTDRPARSTGRSTGSQTGPVRVCLDQIYSGSVLLVFFDQNSSRTPI